MLQLLQSKRTAKEESILFHYIYKQRQIHQPQMMKPTLIKILKLSVQTTRTMVSLKHFVPDDDVFMICSFFMLLKVNDDLLLFYQQKYQQ